MKSRSLMFLLAAALLSSCGGGGDDPPPAPGSLDASFGGNGKVSTAVGTGHEQGLAVAFQPDGKIVVAGFSSDGLYDDWVVVRYHADGSLDASFGSGGKVTTDFDGLHDYAYGVVVQPDGKILVAGDASFVSGLGYNAVVRYTADGALDPTFDGDGIAAGPVGGNAHSIALQADGKVVVAGQFNNGASSDFAVWRYNADGSPDATFDADGMTTTAVGPSYSAAWSAVIQPDGKIVVGGDSYGTTTDFALVRYHADGSLDANFGVAGIQITDVTGGHDWGRSLQLQPDGKLMLAGYGFTTSIQACVVVRYRANGSQDPDFGVGGILLTDFGTAGGEARAAVLHPDGKTILVGFASTPSDHDLGVVRATADGILDADFDGDGRVTTPVGQGIEQLNAVAIDSEGRIVAVGFFDNGADDDILVVRYFD